MFLIIVALSFCAAYIATAILFIIFGWEMTSAGLWACIIILTILFTALFYRSKGNAEACPKCGKKFAMKEISREVKTSYKTTMDVEQKIKNNKGEVTGTYTQTVPATLYVYNCVDQCKFCKYQQNISRQATYRD